MNTFWVIREIATGKLFPASKSRGNTSYHEFADDLPPRLFSRRQDALFVARWWVRGHTFQTYAQRMDEYDSFQMTTKPVDGRSLDALELVKMTLTEVPGTQNRLTGTRGCVNHNQQGGRHAK